MSVQQYDVIVIGAGPAGYVAAIRSAQLGLKTACIDNWARRDGKPSLGGTFINAGCISSMALLESARLYQTLNRDLDHHGISIDNLRLDLRKMVARKDSVIAGLNEQIKSIFDQHQIDCYLGHGKLVGSQQVDISPLDQSPPFQINGSNIILATGSRPSTLPCAIQDDHHIINSIQALNLPDVPPRLGIIGAGIIGLELAGIWNKLGSEVILLEAQESFLNATDQQISQEAYLIYTQQGLDIRLGSRVMSALVENNKVKVIYQDQDGNHSLILDKLIVATGRVPNSDNLAAPEVNLLQDDNGFIHVDNACCTNLPGVYAIGDLTLLGPMLAHKGQEEGIYVAEQIAGQSTSVNYAIIPSVIYTDPEIAWVGHTEQHLIAIGEPYKVGIFPFRASARAQSLNKPEGMIKIITQAETDLILGVHIIGVQASDLIAEAVLAMEFSASSEDLARTIHAHPTISEVLHEAALTLADRSIHLPPRH